MGRVEAAETRGMLNSGYELFDHTADVGLNAWGATPASAFVAAAQGMFAIILGVDPVWWRGAGSAQRLSVEVDGDDWADLLVNWLAELLFHFEVDAAVPIEISMDRCQPPRCSATVDARTFGNSAGTGGVAVKAVTYHELRVAVGVDRTDLHVIFDI